MLVVVVAAQKPRRKITKKSLKISLQISSEISLQISLENSLANSLANSLSRSVTKSLTTVAEIAGGEVVLAAVTLQHDLQESKTKKHHRSRLLH